jgi:hypothetical protein
VDFDESVKAFCAMLIRASLSETAALAARRCTGSWTKADNAMASLHTSKFALGSRPPGDTQPVQ